jgi:hypothetical protein
VAGMDFREACAILEVECPPLLALSESSLWRKKLASKFGQLRALPRCIFGGGNSYPDAMESI